MNRTGLDAIINAIENVQSAQKYNLCEVITALLFSVITEEAGKGLKGCDINDLVRIVMDSSR